MTMIKNILWDFDNTLLDFDVAEENAIKLTFQKLGLGECDDAMLKEYRTINNYYWQKIESKEIDKRLAIVKRFEDFFVKYNIECKSASKFNIEYELALTNTIVYNDDSFELIKSLKKTHRQYIVSNGVKEVQKLKIQKSGLDKLMDGIFISDEIGAEKPQVAFFDYVLNSISTKDLKENMIVGDSLTSDIKGGNNVGIITCWYNPANKKKTDDYKIDYTISNLNQVKDIVM